jgi:hypothetical protein
VFSRNQIEGGRIVDEDRVLPPGELIQPAVRRLQTLAEKRGRQVATGQHPARGRIHPAQAGLAVAPGALEKRAAGKHQTLGEGPGIVGAHGGHAAAEHGRPARTTRPADATSITARKNTLTTRTKTVLPGCDPDMSRPVSGQPARDNGYPDRVRPGNWFSPFPGPGHCHPVIDAYDASIPISGEWSIAKEFP